MQERELPNASQINGEKSSDRKTSLLLESKAYESLKVHHVTWSCDLHDGLFIETVCGFILFH